MKFKLNHDYHIHSYLSSCSRDSEQNCENILNAAEKHGIEELCLTDHFWDSSVRGASNWYKPQNYEHIASALPLPQRDNIRFYFGCETDMDKHMTIGLAPENYDKFDFVIIPTTHLHMSGFKLMSLEDGTQSDYTERLAAFFHGTFKKIGIAHLLSLITRRKG